MTNTPDHTHVLGRDGFCKTAGCLVMPKATPDQVDALEALTEVMLDMNRYGCPSLIIRPEDGNAWAASITVNLTGKQWDMTTLEEEGDTALEAAQRLSQRLAEIVSQDKSSKNASSEELEKQRKATE